MQVAIRSQADPISIRQDTGTANLGFSVWDVSLIIVKHLGNNYNKVNLAGKRVLVLGQAVAWLASAAHTHRPDLADVLPQIPDVKD